MSVPISIAASPYDGHDVPVMLDSLRACGAHFVEPAFITGYSDPFDEATFTTAKARQYRRWLDTSGVLCHAVSSHYDLGRADAVDVFTRRMAFAAALGARVVNTIAAPRDAGLFFHNIEKLAVVAEALDLVIALENPGHGEDNLYNGARDGLALIAELGMTAVRLNYDPANAATHRDPPVDSVAAALAVLPGCAYFHVKDVVQAPDGWRFVPPGQGQIGYDRIMPALVAAGVPFSLPLPLRVRRLPGGQVVRDAQTLTLPEIEEAVKAALAYAARWAAD